MYMYMQHNILKSAILESYFQKMIYLVFVNHVKILLLEDR